MKLWRSTAIACALAGTLGVTGNANALTLNETFNGQWAEVGSAGSTTNRGLNLQFIRVAPEQYVAFATGFLYGDDGTQLWFAGTDGSVIPGDTTIDFTMTQFDGGAPFGGAAGSANTQTSLGTFSFEVNTCNSASASWTSADGAPFGSGIAEFDRGVSTLGAVLFAGPDVCAFQQAFDNCPAFSNGVGPVPRSCFLSGTFTDDITLTNDILWVLDNSVFIGEPSSVNNSNNITIEPGTRIVALPGGNAEAFVISRGAKMFAIGTPFAPIIFSSANPTNVAAAGDFGGLIINGFAQVNNCSPLPGGCQSEGFSDVLYGGGDATNDFDSSGIIKYVRVQFGGDDISPDNQLNGIAFQGVGAGTTVDFIQVHSNDDDGIEWFGGTVRVTHAVVSSVSDDSLDWVNGWRGSLQYAVVDQQGQGDQGIEADNFDDNPVAEPRSLPQLANLTLNGSPQGDIGILLRQGTGANITNSIVKGFGEGCFDIDTDSTFDQSFDNGTPNGTLTVQNTYFACDTNFIEEGGDAVDLSDFFDSQNGNTTFAGFPGIFPPNGASFLRDRTMDASVFGALDLVEYAGAFESEANAWTAGWTEFLE